MSFSDFARKIIMLSAFLLCLVICVSGCAKKNGSADSESKQNVSENSSSKQEDKLTPPVISEYTFEEFEHTVVPTYPWIIDGDGFVTADSSGADNNVVLIQDSSNLSTTVADLFFDRVYADTTISVDIMVPKYCEWSISIGPDDVHNYSQAGVSGRTDGMIVYSNDNIVGSFLTNYDENTWFNIAFNLRPSKAEYDILFDGMVLASNVPFDRNAAAFKYVATLRFSTNYSQRGLFYFDNVKAPEIKLTALEKYVPSYKQHQILSQTSPGDEMQYHGFPSLQWVNDREVLIVYHRGIKHAYAHGVLEAILYDTVAEKVVKTNILYDDPNQNAQNAEIMTMPNGDIVIYLDVQKPDSTADTIYNLEFRSTDGGKTFTKTESALVDNVGTKYSVLFDYANVGEVTYALAYFTSYMNPGLNDGVNAIKSTDSGKTWQVVKNLTMEFNYKFNESTLVPYEDGFIIACRGAKKVTQIFRVDSKFKMVESKNLRLDYNCIGHIGKPLLFEEDGEYFLLARNILPDMKNEMTLTLHKIDPATLSVLSYVELEPNNTGNNGGDGFYAEYYMQEKDGKKHFNVVTYTKAYSDNHKPQIVRFEYDWEEIKNIG